MWNRSQDKTSQPFTEGLIGLKILLRQEILLKLYAEGCKVKKTKFFLLFILNINTE